MNLDSVTIRPARQTDLPSLVTLESRTHINPWSEKLISQSLSGAHLIWVAHLNDQIVGYLVVMPIVDQWELLNVAVDSDFQGKGIGSLWMKHLKSQASQNHIKQVFLEVRESNAAAISLYCKVGFERVGLRKNYYPASSGREDALVMQININ